MSCWSVNIESLQTRDTVLHGWGLLQGTGSPPTSSWLEARQQGIKGVMKIPAIFGKHHKCTDRVNINIEFVIYGRLKKEPHSNDIFELILEWADNRELRYAIAHPYKIPSNRGIVKIISLPWKHYLKRSALLIRQGQSKLLIRKFTSMAMTFFSTGDDLQDLLAQTESEGKPLALVIDHDLGGGANLYRRIHMERLTSEGFVPILLTAHIGLLTYQLTAKTKNRIWTVQVDDLNVLFHALSKENFERVVFNNIVSFPAPVNLVNTLARWLRHGQRKEFIFLMHDHYCICPSWLLLNNEGQFCNIPDASICANCLPKNKALFLGFSEGIDIISWREEWIKLLKEANEIRCFSNTTKNLLIRAYLELNPLKITVLPHTLEHVKLRKISLNNTDFLVIGVVGQISHHKGARIVRDLADHISAIGSRARIVIIGTIEDDLAKNVATVTGPYRPEDLPMLLEKYGVNVGLFPSIWPETFSYVTEELIQMGLPLLSFDFGAPAERVGKYYRGQIIPLGGPNEILTALEELYKKHVFST